MNAHTDSQSVAVRLRAAMESQDLEAYGALLDDNVRWGPADETPETCHSRAQVLKRLATQRARGMQTQLLEVVPGDSTLLVGFNVKSPVEGGFLRGQTRYQVLRVRNSQIVDIRGYSNRAEAAAAAGMAPQPERGLEARHLVPVLNVSNLADSFTWFAKLGWTKRWDWSEADGPPSFGAVGSGQCEIFLSLNGQGGRGDGQGMWLSIWIDDVDAAHAICQREGIEVLQPPRGEPFRVREMHVRHPDGHVFRMSQPSHQH
jgi:ketosteroid isomerase-like protein